MATILVCDDDKQIVEAIDIYLTGEGFHVIKAYDGAEALKLLDSNQVDLMILDVMMPGIDGYELARRIRARHLGTPILMLTAKSELEDRITGLDSGADYYLTKPFDTRELLACVGALLRRQGGQVDEIVLGNTALNLSSAVLTCGTQSIRLSAKEFDIMRLLLQDQGRNYSKEMILERVWGYDSDAVENHVEVYIGFLRRKLAGIGSNIRIETIRRLGYHLEVREDNEPGGERR